jgi:hypothetical protein
LFLHAIRAPSIATNTRHETLIFYEKNVESLKYFAAAIENAISKPTNRHLDLGSTDGLPPSRNQSQRT